MGTFSQLGGVVAKAATVESPIVVKNADGTYDVTFQYEDATANEVKLMGDQLPNGSWNYSQAISMKKSGNIWSVKLGKVEAGSYEYKFKIGTTDNDWRNDSGNPLINGDNNLLILGEKPYVSNKKENGKYDVTFFYVDTENKIKNVLRIVGDEKLTGFNWSVTDSPEFHKKNGSNIWMVTLTDISAGPYQYKFVWDNAWSDNNGVQQSVKDPANEKVNGENSLITIGATYTSPEVDGKKVTFRYPADKDTKVYLAGTMTSWAAGQILFDKYDEENGIWSLTKTLSAGTYEYKLIIGENGWITDPANPLPLLENGNSQLIIPGLSDASMDVVTGDSATLPEKLTLYAEDGKTTEVEVTYAFKDTPPEGIKLDKNTLTIDKSAKAQTFVLTASDKDNHTSDVTIDVSDTIYTYNIYYFDWNSSHMDPSKADMHYWKPKGADFDPISFTGTKEIDGKTWLTATVTTSLTSFGLIPRSKGGWDWKTSDHIVDNQKKANPCDIYIVYGDEATYYELPELPDEQPRKLYVPGTFPGLSWDPASNEMTYSEELGCYTYTFKNVPAANYEFKIAVNAAWDENYGVGGKAGGSNYSVSVPETMDVTIYYSDETHLAVTSLNYEFLDVDLTGTEIPEGTKLTDAGLTGIYSAKVKLPKGTYSDIKLEVEEKGISHSYNTFTLDSEKEVTFYYSPVYDVYYHDAAPWSVGADGVKYDSKDSEYKSVFGAVATGEEVTFSLSADSKVTGATLVVSRNGAETYPMEKDGNAVDGVQKWSTKAKFDTIGEYEYFFIVYQDSAVKVYSDDDGYYGTGKLTDLTNILPYDLIVYKSGYKTPDWMKNAVIYQIFPDRFYNGDKSNDKKQEHARGAVKYEFIEDWYTLPENPEQEALIGAEKDGITEEAYNSTGAHKGDKEWSNEIYGGDLKGIIDRMDYLKALGVNVIYLNPVFASISSHRYDTSDYKKIDPILGTEGDFTKLVEAAKKYDMHIVLDGVFNHVSDDSKYFDRYYRYLELEKDAKTRTGKIGAYPYWAYVYDYMADNKVEQAAAEAAAKNYFESEYGITNFDYTEWFEIFNEPMSDGTENGTVKDTIGERKDKDVYGYDGWWGYDSMPIIKSTNGSEYQTGNWAEEIIEGEGSVGQYWISKGNNGWRLDVANEVSDETWQHFRESVKSLNSDAVIIGEIWDDASKYLMGDMYDSVMNYVFRNAVTGFAKDGNAQNAMNTLEKIRERYPKEAFYAMMNLVGSHDTTRVLSYLDGIDDDRNQKDLASAFPTYEKTSDAAKAKQYLVSFLQFTYAGAPTIYYGDEIGMVGSDDPDDRRAFEWGKGNKELVTWYASLAAIRNSYSALRTGSVEPIVTGNDNVLGFVRRDSNDALIVLANGSASSQTITLKLSDLNVEAASLSDLLGASCSVTNGVVKVTIPARRGVILTEAKKTIKVNQKALAPAYENPENNNNTVQEGNITVADTQEEEGLSASLGSALEKWEPETFVDYGIFTEDDLDQKEQNGVDLSVYLTINKYEVTSKETALLEKALQTSSLDGFKLEEASYVDIDLFKKIGQLATQLETLGGEIEITISIPDELYKLNREYQIIRVHDGKAEALETKFNSKTGELTFMTDRFSLYAIAYKDVTPTSAPKPELNNQQTDNTGTTNGAGTGDNSPILPFAVLFTAAAVLVVFTAVRRRKAK